jgi:hypothetical protein
MTKTRMIWSGHVARMKGMHTQFVRKPQGKVPLGGSRPRWEDSVKKYIK